MLFEKPAFKGFESILAMPIWYNSNIIKEKFEPWVKKGIMTIGDVIDTNGNILSKHIIEQT